MTDRLIKITRALVVVAVAVVAAVISYQHAYELVRSLGALVSAWPAVALIGSFELLMMLIRTGRRTRAGKAEPEPRYQPVPPLAQEAPLELPVAPALEQTVRARYEAGHSQRAIARELNSYRRKIKRILDQAA